MKHNINRAYGHILILVVYSLVYFYYSSMFPWNFAHELPGKLDHDMSQFLWNAHHFSEWVKGNQNYFYTDLIFAPYGTSLHYHTFSHLMAGTSYLVGNSFLGINIIIWLHYIFSGLGAYLLARHFKLNKVWAFTVGFIFAFIPYKFSHYSGHYNLQQTAFIPFFILYFFKSFPYNPQERLFSKFSLRKGISLLFLGVGCLLSSYLYTMFLVFFCMGYLLFYIVNRLLPNKWYQLILLIALTITASNVIPYIQQLGLNDNGAFWWADDMGKFFTPNWNNKLYHQLTPFFYNHYERLELKHSDSFIGFLIPILSVLVAIFLLITRSRKRSIAVMGFLSIVFFMLMSPKILIFKTHIGFFPTSVYHYVPVLNNLRIPERFVIMFALFFSIYLFTYMQGFTQNGNKLYKLFPLSICFLLFLEFGQSHIDKSNKNDFPTWTAMLASMPTGNLLPIPTGINDGNKALGNLDISHLYYQSIHKHKLIGGYVSRITDELRDQFQHNKVFNSILLLSEQKETTFEFTKEEIEDFLNEFQPRYFLVNRGQVEYINFVQHYFSESITNVIEADDDLIFILE